MLVAQRHSVSTIMVTRSIISHGARQKGMKETASLALSKSDEKWCGGWGLALSQLLNSFIVIPASKSRID
jgi:hypothetical protein